MEIVRAPLRIPLGGGGTDLPAYSKQFGGQLVSIAINKYIFVNITQDFEAGSQDDEYIAAAKEHLKITSPLTVNSISEVPFGTGLGSSGAYIAALLKALHLYLNKNITQNNLAELAFHIEADVLKKPIGRHDQYISVFGGVTKLEIPPSGPVTVTQPKLSANIITRLEESLMVFYTQTKGSSTKVLTAQNQSLKHKNTTVTESMHYIKQIGGQIYERLLKGDIAAIGRLMDEHWQYKKQISPLMTDPHIDRLYEVAKNYGALGGKIMGAGGRGFMVFVCPNDQHALCQQMTTEGLIKMPFKIDFEGVNALS